MKKLMIAAAVAAMIGGAEAAYEYVYDFTASVKSTGAKSGKDKNYTVNCGQNSEGKWWWEDIEADEAAAKDAVEAAIEAYEEDPTSTDLEDILETLEFDGKKTAYNKKDKLTKKWCYTFTFTEKALCYRVAKSYKLKDKFVTDCCGDAWTSYEGATDSGLALDFLQKFNAANYDSANKAEIYGELTAPTAFNDVFALNGVDDEANVDAWLAGQGSWKFNKDEEEYYADGISGNIVGTWAGATCPDCCGRPGIPAIAFDCGDDDPADDLDTALFGTFTLKINKKDTKAANAAE